MAAQIAAQALGPEFKQWLNDPQKLLQLIAAAQGASSGGSGERRRRSTRSRAHGADSCRVGYRNWYGYGLRRRDWFGNMVRRRRSLAGRGSDSDHSPADALWPGDAGSQRSQENLEVELGKVPESAKVNLAQLLEHLASQAAQNKSSDGNDTPLLMKAAESMAIKFALDRYSKGEVKVNAVHDMMEHMSRQMDTLRQILRVQEDKMSKAGILVESHADILDRMFWAEIPEAGKKSVSAVQRSGLRAAAQHPPVRRNPF